MNPATTGKNKMWFFLLLKMFKSKLYHYNIRINENSIYLVEKVPETYTQHNLRILQTQADLAHEVPEMKAFFFFTKTAERRHFVLIFNFCQSDIFQPRKFKHSVTVTSF